MDFKKILYYNNEKLSLDILRIGLALTIFWFGVSQLISPNNWIGYVPIYMDSIFPFFSLKTIVILNGIFETITALLLIFNKFTKIVSLLLAIHLIIIIIDLGFTEIGIRDFGILVGLVSLYLNSKK